MWQLRCDGCNQLITNIMKALRCNSKCNRWYHSWCVHGMEGESESEGQGTYWCVEKEHWTCEMCKAESQMNNNSVVDVDVDVASPSNKNNELISPFSTVMQLFNDIHATESSAFEEQLNCVKVKMTEMKTQLSNSVAISQDFTRGDEQNAFSLRNMRFGFYLDNPSASPVTNQLSSLNFAATTFRAQIPSVQNNCKLNVLRNDSFSYFCPPEKKFKSE